MAYLLFIAATALSIGVAKRRRAYRPIAVLLAFGLVADVVRLIIAPTTSGPFHGVDRLLFHIRQLLFLGWYAGATLLADRFFLWSRFRNRVIGGWCLLSMVPILGYPSIRGDLLARLYFVVHCATVGFLGAAATVWWKSNQALTLERSALLILLTCETAALLWGPFSTNSLWNHWNLAVVAYQCAFIALIVLQGMTIWKRFRSFGE